MRKIVALTALLLLSPFYTTSPCSAQASKVFAFPISNASPMGFGYDCPKQGGPGIGPCALAIHDSVAFIVDNYHDNVKKVALKTGLILATTLPSGEHKRWFCDAVVSDGYVLVSTNLESLYVFDLSLQQVDRLQVLRGDEYFYWEKDTLFLSNALDEDSYQVSVVNRKVILKERKPILHDIGFFVPGPHRKAYNVAWEHDSWVFRNDPPDMIIGRKIPKVDCYDAISLDCDGRHVVFFDVSKDRMNLHVVDCPQD